MGNLKKFPKEYIDALLRLEQAKKSQYAPEQKTEELFGRKAFWCHFSGIKLEAPLANLHLDQSIASKSTSTLKDFLQYDHKGSIDNAINGINHYVDIIGYFSGIKNYCEQLKYLELVGDFLKEARLIVKRGKTKNIEPEENHDKSDMQSLIVQEQASLDPVTNDITYYERHPNFQVIKLPPKQKGARVPNQLMAGYCLICPNTSPTDAFYCRKHTRSTGDESEIKKARRLIESAFSNLNLTSTYNTDKDKRAPKKFEEKCNILEAWAKPHPEHQGFNTDLKNIIKKYFNLDESSDWPEGSSDWPESTAKMLTEIMQLSKRHKHTSDMINLYFSSNKPVSEIVQNLQNKIFHLDEKELLTPSTAFIIISRMSQFRLLELAASGKIQF